MSGINWTSPVMAEQALRDFEAEMQLRADSETNVWRAANWRRFVVGPGIPALEYGRQEAPTFGGLYFLWSAEDELLYIGISENIYYRLHQHRKLNRIPFSSVSAIEVPIGASRVFETAYIHALRPPYNVKYDIDSWVGHDRMMRLVRRIWRGNKITRPLVEDEPC